MNYLRKYIKVVSAFLMLNMVNYIFFPIASMALTSGPVAPEYTSFEPFDTTDMVNLQTGDFTYNVPLFEVPGPGGEFPLNLAYHAGIQPDMEASWVGLGWTLNPGSITRYVNGYPDDSKTDQVNRKFWEGGETKQKSIGVSFGPGFMGGASAGISVSNDSYKGRGRSAYLNAGGFNASVGFSGSNAGYQYSAGLSSPGGIAESDAKSLSEFAGQQISAAKGKLKNAKQNALGIALTTLVSKSTPLSISGGNFAQHEGGISTSGRNFNLSLPLGNSGLFLNLGMRNMRYWSDETNSVMTHGSLYNNTYADYRNNSFDIYDVSDYDEGVEKNYKPELDNLGTFLNNDVFSVQTHGLHGNMRPYHYKAYLNRRDITHEDALQNEFEDVLNYQIFDIENIKTGFRFAGDFSNKRTFDPCPYPICFDPPVPPIPFDLKLGDTEETILELEENIGKSEVLKIPGSRDIAYVTNAEFDQSGFIDFQSASFQRPFCPPEGIGGFQITSESGMTFHFSLPVYAEKEEVFSENIDRKKKFEDGLPVGGRAFNHLSKPQKYAYTWLLTAITGPDFVDRGGVGDTGDGTLNEDDWGYWVSFDYGKWEEDFRWRNPQSGSHKDLDNNFQTFSKGTKEIYYLDKIKTSTHTALFVKSERMDSRGTTSEMDLAVDASNQTVHWVDEGGSYPASGRNCANTGYVQHAQTLLKLDEIILLRNEDAIGVSTNQVGESTTTTMETCNDGLTPFHNGKYFTLDQDDIPIEIRSKSLRTVKFDQDYRLAPFTPNSLPNSNFGKLTLNKLQFLGKQEIGIIPPTLFTYNIDEPSYNLSFEVLNEELDGSLNNYSSLTSGDVVRIKNAVFDDAIVPEPEAYYYYEEIPGVGHLLKFIGGNPYPFDGQVKNVSVTKTKNPAYSRDHHDIWGFFKSDYVDTEQNNLDRLVTYESSLNVDAWSLREISTPLGGKVRVDYESDTYKRSVYNKSYPIVLGDVTYENGNLTGTLQSYVDLSNGSMEVIITEEADMIVVEDHRTDETKENPPTELDDEWAATTSPKSATLVSQNGTDVVISVSGYSEGQFYDIVQVNINIDIAGFNYGGGVRVSSIEVHDPIFNRSQRTKYDYSNRDISAEIFIDGPTSGVTSYEPIIMDPVFKTLDESERTKVARAFVSTSFKDILAYSRFIPPPGVIYEYIEVKDETEDETGTYPHPTASIYEFQVFNKALIKVQNDDVLTTEGSSSPIQAEYGKIREVDLHDFSAAVGSIKSISLINNDLQLISRTSNDYLLSGLITGEEGNEDISPISYESRLQNFNNQGLIEESYANGRYVRIKDANDQDIMILVGNKSSIHTYPNIQTRQKSINYRSGNISQTDYLKFDPYSGQPTEVRSTTNNDTLLVVTVPAYRLPMIEIGGAPRYPGMGIRVGSSNTILNDNKNFLVQEGASYTYKLNHNYEKVGLISATLQTWSDETDVLKKYEVGDGPIPSFVTQPEIFRKLALYNFNGKLGLTNKNGIYVENSSGQPFEEFAFSPGTNTPGSEWDKISEVTIYDPFSNPLEITDINNNYSSIKFTQNHDRALATAANAKYDEFIASTFESGVEGLNDVNIASDVAHTGSQSHLFNASGFLHYEVDPEAISDQSFDVSRTYLISYWTDGSDHTSVIPNILYGGQEKALENVYKDNKSVITSDGIRWYQHIAIFTLPDNIADLKIGVKSNITGVHIDDFRFHPVDATVTAYVYDQWDELSFVLDKNNLFTHYEYDAMGNLSLVSRESFTHGIKTITTGNIEYSELNLNAEQ